MADGRSASSWWPRSGVLARDEVDMVVIPGEEGDFGVLPEHAPFLSLLRPGVIAIYEGDRVSSASSWPAASPR